MTRENQLRTYLRERFPEVRFSLTTRNVAGVIFGTVRGEDLLVPAVHPATILLHAVPFSDGDFRLLLEALASLIETVYLITEREPTEWDKDTLVTARVAMQDAVPDKEAVLARIWDQPIYN